jgi:putative membrane-bound dehydrogenase-like protein
MKTRAHSIPLIAATVVCVAIAALAAPRSKNEPAPKTGAIRVLFLGHESKHHNSNQFYPMLAKGLGRDAIYFDYVTSVEGAFGDAEYLGKFDAVLLYANHGKITPDQWKNLKGYVEGGGGFVPVHCASWCFGNEPEFDQLVGGRFDSHKTGTFTAKVVATDHPAMSGVKEFEAWDETYKHRNHNEKDRTVLMVREVAGESDNITEPEPWTWVRTQGEGRVFYTASGHDERVWKQPAFHQLLKAGILWSAGDGRKQSYEKFISGRAPLKYEKRGDIANYENRPEPLPYQFPLSAKDSMDYTQAPVGFRLELFASEPEIINPIGLAWDERGRLWAAETVDYPNELTPDRVGNDKIKILEDTDGDGKCDKVTVFADGLNIPTSLTFSRGGIIVAHVPDFLFLKDTDGDDKADVREVLNTGWGTGDTHAGPSNLRYGFDNWIWGTVGYSSFNGTVGGEQKRFGSGVFRMKPDGSALEFLHQFNNNTWGLGFNSAGDVFGSTANNNPSFFCGIRATAYGEGKKGMSAKMIATDRSFHPITPNIRQVDAFNNYTAGAGHTVATSAAFPESYREEVAFIGGPTGHLLGKYHLSRDGSGYKAKNGFAFLASADEWFSPVAAEVGPDGHLWVADWYNFIIQHNPTPNKGRGGYDAKNGKGNAHINPNRDRGHGRIYRAVWEKAPVAKIKSLAGASDAQLVAALDSDNLFWRHTAQRLLVDGGRKDAAPALKSKVRTGGTGAIQALWSLSGLGALDAETHQAALMSKDPTLRRNAITALGNDAAALQLFFDTAVVQDDELIVRLAAFNKMAELDDKETVVLAAKQLITDNANASDPWLSQSLRNAGAGSVQRGPSKLGKELLANGSFEKLSGEFATGWAGRSFRGTAEHRLSDTARTGKHSIEISADKAAEWGVTLDVPVDRNSEYELSAWVKTEKVGGGGRGALLYISAHPDAPGSNGVKGTQDWTQIKLRFNSGAAKSASINCLFGGWGTSTGKAWWDDISLRKVEYETIAGDEPKVTRGDVERGKKIFTTHQIANCARCHAVGGVGGVVGPALDTIATRKQEDYILESLVDPGATIAEGFQGKVSPMPPMGVLLKPQELADVMAYLMTLK